jgi:AmiR/NasT family two-component response regulator
VRSQIDLGQLRRLAIEQVEERAGNLMIALETNRRIGVAVGILQALQRITPEAAFSLLREVSQRQNRKLREVAEDVIEYGTFDVTPPSRNGVRTS